MAGIAARASDYKLQAPSVPHLPSLSHDSENEAIIKDFGRNPEALPCMLFLTCLNKWKQQSSVS